MVWARVLDLGFREGSYNKDYSIVGLHRALFTRNPKTKTRRATQVPETANLGVQGLGLCTFSLLFLFAVQSLEFKVSGLGYTGISV